jgi:hypothetical protein
MTCCSNCLISVMCCPIMCYALVKIFFLGFPGQILNFCMKKIHARVKNTKEDLFKEALSNVNTNNKSGKLEILEIGEFIYLKTNHKINVD